MCACCLNAQLLACVMQAEVVPGEVAPHIHTLPHTQRPGWWKLGTRTTVKVAPEAYPIIQHQMPWSPTCTTKQDPPSLTDWHAYRVDPTSSVWCSNKNPANHTFTLFIKENKTTVHKSAVAFLPVTQPVRPCSESNVTQVAQRCGKQQQELQIASCC